MARPVADNCMFCAAIPCKCNAKKSPTPRATRPKASPPPVAAPTSSVSEQHRITGAPGKVGPPQVAVPTETQRSRMRSARPNLSSVARVRDPEVEAMNRAVTVFAEADMIHHEDLERLRDMIQLPAHRINAMIWKQVNYERVHGAERGGSNDPGQGV